MTHPRDTLRLLESPEFSLERLSFALFAQPDGFVNRHAPQKSCPVPRANHNSSSAPPSQRGGPTAPAFKLCRKHTMWISRRTQCPPTSPTPLRAWGVQALDLRLPPSSLLDPTSDALPLILPATDTPAWSLRMSPHPRLHPRIPSLRSCRRPRRRSPLPRRSMSQAMGARASPPRQTMSKYPSLSRTQDRQLPGRGGSRGPLAVYRGRLSRRLPAG